MRGVTVIIDKLLYARIFQLTRLMRGVTARFVTAITSAVFQLTRLMRGVTDLELAFNPAS